MASDIEMSEATGYTGPKLMIYGASGHIGRQASIYAKELGLDVMLAGRNGPRMRALARELQLACSIFHLSSDKGDVIISSGFSAILNCAGPFHQTAKPLMEKCIKYGVHYLDISAEWDTYRIAESLNKEAKAANVMLMPGCGGSVGMLGYMTQVVLESNSTSKPISVDVVLHITGTSTPASVMRANTNLTNNYLQRRNGKLVPWTDDDEPLKFDFGLGKGIEPCLPMTLPALVTLRRSTGIQNIRTFIHTSTAANPVSDNVVALSDGLPSSERMPSTYQAAVIVTFEDKIAIGGILGSFNSHLFAAQVSMIAASEAISGEMMPGFQTLVRVFGTKFLTSACNYAVTYA